MKNNYIKKLVEKEFKSYVRQNLLKPGDCKRIDQTNRCIDQMHRLMSEYKLRFNFVPTSAQVIFSKYQNIQDRMVYENFRDTYQKVLC